MRILILFPIFAIALAAHADRDIIPVAINADLGQLYSLTLSARSERLATYDAAYREELIKWGRIWVQERPPGSLSSDHYDDFLIHLGDREALARAIRDF